MSVGWGVGMIRMGGAGPVALYLPAASVNYVSTPDAPANSIPGDIDVRIKLAAADWTPTATREVLLAKITNTGVFAWQFAILSSGALEFILSTNGSIVGPAVSTASTGFTDGTEHWVRVTRRQSDGRQQFFTSSDGASWTQLGSDVLVFAATTIFDSTGPITIGARGDGGAPLAGTVYYAELRDGIGGTVVHTFDTSTVTKIGTRDPSTIAAGGPWTVVGSAWDWVAAA